MNIERSNEFKPITITLESSKEVTELLECVDHVDTNNETSVKISDWFTANGYELS